MSTKDHRGWGSTERLEFYGGVVDVKRWQKWGAEGDKRSGGVNIANFTSLAMT